MMAGQQYCLRWNNHQPNFISVFSSLLHNKTLVDVTLSAEGKHLQAHKLVLSACSSYFQTLFSINPCQHPIVILKDVKFIDLRVMVDFMYYGEVNVSQEQLPYILKTAEMLKIKGLAEMPVEPSVQKAQSNTSERTELLAPGDGNWNSENSQRQSLSPSPCPLSPSSRRKRLRKSSTGSGSGSAERASEDHQSSEVTLMSPSCGGGGGSSGLGTVIKPDPGGFTSDSSTTHRSKQHSSDSDVHRTSSHESVESDPPHQITLQIPQQDVNIQHTIDASSMEMPGPSVSSAQTITGYQWGIVDHMGFSHYPTPNTLPLAPELHYTTVNITPEGMSIEQETSPENKPQTNQPTNPIPPKRKRSINPQADENFVRALEAVRFGGIGFCKAARMFGVNNRTLWLEYKKRGYPISRLSIKNRNKDSQQQQNQQQQQHQQQQNQQQQQKTPTQSPQSQNAVDNNQPVTAVSQENEVNVSNSVGMFSAAFMDGRPVEMIQRSTPRYFDNNLINSQHAINLGLSFDPMT